MQRRALILSSDNATLSSVRDELASLGCASASRARPSSGLKAIGGSELIVLDMADEVGLATLSDIKSYHPGALVVVAAPPSFCMKAMEGGAFDYLDKPLDPLRLRCVLRQALRFMDLRAELDALKSVNAPRLVYGRNLKMLQALKQMEKVSGRDFPVLLSGEKGTGRALAAKTIHCKGPRRAGPFVTVAASEGRLEKEELFGTRSAPGRVAAAAGGTLFVEDLGEQGDLGWFLEFLRGGSFIPVEEGGPVRADLRVICSATPEAVKGQALKGGFGAEIKLPALRERREDIIALTEHFIKEAEETFRSGPRTLSKAARRFVLSYDWPGNVGELKNTVKKAYLLSKGSEIDRHHLTFGDYSVYGSVKEFLEDKLKRYIRQMTDMRNSGLYNTVISEVEKALMELALKETGGNQIRAAKILGINRTTLRTKIKGYKIESVSAPGTGKARPPA
jgi:two-component system nitrogen regulation response regulator GlnG